MGDALAIMIQFGKTAFALFVMALVAGCAFIIFVNFVFWVFEGASHQNSRQAKCLKEATSGYEIEQCRR